MNLLFYMLGRGRPIEGTRTTPRQQLLADAAAHAAAGRFENALAAYGKLDQVSRSSSMDLLVRGHLALVAGRANDANEHFIRGAAAFLRQDCPALSSPSNAEPTSLESMLDHAGRHFLDGRYVRAEEQLQRVRGTLNILLTAEAGIHLASSASGRGDSAAVVSMVKLGDLVLRLMARTHLAGTLATSLRERHLRDDLAPWATTGQSVDKLLDAEFDRLLHASCTAPGQAETHFRLALVARALQRFDVAITAFSRTLQLHPHHLPSAVRLFATRVQMNCDSGNDAMLNRAFHVPAETLATFAGFARAAGDAPTFDRLAETFCAHQGKDAATARANLAFALSEVAMLDDLRATWRETAPV